MRLIFLGTLFCIVTSSDGTKCFECMDVQFPRDCVKLTDCNSDELCLGVSIYDEIGDSDVGGDDSFLNHNQVCFTEQVVHSSGRISFNSGCLHKSRCSTISTPLFGKRSTNITSANTRSTDIITCRECCVGDVCNSKGCGANEIPIEQRGPYCYICDVLDPKGCNEVAVCGKNEVCMIYSPVEFSALPDTLYRGQCETHVACNALSHTLNSPCEPTCCNTDFCNDHCGTPSNVSMTTSYPETTEGNKETTTSKQNSHIVTTPTSHIVSTPTSHIVTTPTPHIVTTPTSHIVTTPTNTPSSSTSGNHSSSNSTGFTLLESGNTHFYVKIITQQKKSWDDARATCKQQGGDLVVLNTHYKSSLLRQFLENDARYHHKFFWIGLKDFNNNDHFSWVNHHQLQAGASWAKGQPDHYSHGKHQDCVCMHSDAYPQYKWNDQDCNAVGYFICERK